MSNKSITGVPETEVKAMRQKDKYLEKNCPKLIKNIKSMIEKFEELQEIIRKKTMKLHSPVNQY